MQLQYAMEEYRENAFSARELRRQINEIERSKLTGRGPQMRQFRPPLFVLRTINQPKRPAIRNERKAIWQPSKD